MVQRCLLFYTYTPIYAILVDGRLTQKITNELYILLNWPNQTVVQAQAQARSNVARAEGESQAIKVIRTIKTRPAIFAMAIHQ
jgi:hypothetical protein